MEKEKIIIGWCGVNYEDTGLFETREDADRGYRPDKRFYELFNPYDGKRIKITIEVVEE